VRLGVKTALLQAIEQNSSPGTPAAKRAAAASSLAVQGLYGYRGSQEGEERDSRVLFSARAWHFTRFESPYLAEMCTALVKFGSTVPGAASMKIVPTRYQLT
jgi:hypothetical protein